MDDLERARRVREAEEAVASLPATPEGAAAITVHWHHESRLPGGDVIPGTKKLPLLATEAEVTFAPLDLKGRTVLDIGAWNGAMTFEAERRGAEQVTAVDQFCWFHPVWKGLETFLFLRKAYGSHAGYAALDIDETTFERVGAFDVVLLLGVFYHLPNPLTCMEQVARITRHCLVLETHCDCLDDSLPAMRYYPGTELGGDPTNWWGPNPPCVVGLLKNAGFAEVVVTEHPASPGRFFFHAYKAQP